MAPNDRVITRLDCTTITTTGTTTTTTTCLFISVKCSYIQFTDRNPAHQWLTSHMTFEKIEVAKLLSMNPITTAAIDPYHQ